MKNYCYQNSICSKIACIPFKNHTKAVKTGLRQISVDTAKLFNECVNPDSSKIEPGEKLCTSCRSKVMDSIKVNKICEVDIHEDESPVRNASDEDFWRNAG
jgi:hypothetical protein